MSTFVKSDENKWTEVQNVQDKNTPRSCEIAIIDLDGTIAQCHEREIFYLTRPKNYMAAEAAVHLDDLMDTYKLIPKIITKHWGYLSDVHYSIGDFGIEKYTVQMITHPIDAKIVISSARADTKLCRTNTTRWLKEKGVEYDALYLRDPNDMRKDYVAKADMLKQIEKDFGGTVVSAFDDREDVLRAYGALGVPHLFQVVKNKIIPFTTIAEAIIDDYMVRDAISL